MPDTQTDTQADRLKPLAHTHTHSDIAAMLQWAVEGGTLADLPVSIVTILLVAPAMHMARGIALRRTALSPDEVQRMFERVWLLIASPLRGTHP
ncbi:MAG: hypothetical protein ACOH2H_00190 [Cypionkella sp.]